MPGFRTRFRQPDAVTLDGVADADASTITLTIGATSEPYFEDYRIYWRDGTGDFVLIAQQTGTTYVDGAARLGVNEYRVTVWNGAQESEPTDLELTLEGAIPGAGMALVPGSDRLRVPLLIDSWGFARNQTRNVLQPLDAPFAIELRGVASGRAGTMSVRVPADEHAWTELLEEMAIGDDPAVIKDIDGRVATVSLGIPQAQYIDNGWEQLSVSWLQVA